MGQNPDVHILTWKVSSQMSQAKCDHEEGKRDPEGKQERVNSHPWLLHGAQHRYYTRNYITFLEKTHDVD